MHTLQSEFVVKDIKWALQEDEEGKTEKVERPKWIKSQAKAFVMIALDQPATFEKYETLESMGRFTLRKGDRSIATGRVHKYKPADPFELQRAREVEETKE